MLEGELLLSFAGGTNMKGYPSEHNITLYGEFTENNPRLRNPQDHQRYNKTLERGLYEISEGQFGIHRKEF